MLYPLRLDTGEFENGSPPFIDLAFAKQHCRVDFADDDALFDLYVAAAVRWAEDTTDRTVFARAQTWILRDFGCDLFGAIRLPRGKVRSIASIVYTAGQESHTLTGPTSTPAGTDWQEDLRSDAGGVLMPIQGGIWPAVDLDAIEPVKITFTAGWLASDIPAAVLHAILFAVSDLYDLRGSNDMAQGLLNNTGARLAAREALISPYRLTRVY